MKTLGLTAGKIIPSENFFGQSRFHKAAALQIQANKLRTDQFSNNHNNNTEVD